MRQFPAPAAATRLFDYGDYTNRPTAFHRSAHVAPFYGQVGTAFYSQGEPCGGVPLAYGCSST